MADIIRKHIVDSGYDLFKNWIFKFTEEDPELAHDGFIESIQFLDESNLAKLFFDNSSNRKEIPFEFSNAAGFNKNADIHPNFLKYLGFNRVVVGTVTHDPWKGNEPKPRIWRYPQTESLVNWLGLPGVGSKRVAENLAQYNKIDIPLTISIMSTPKKEGDAILKDLEGTLFDTRFFGDIIELNESCPNAGHSTDEYQRAFAERLNVVIINSYGKKIRVKISPDMGVQRVSETLEVISNYTPLAVSGIVGTNTTTNHNEQYISNSPGKGGASGKAVQHLSRILQEQFITEIRNRNLPLEYISVGGIDSADEAGYRVYLGASGIQIFTGLIFKGPKLVREIRNRLNPIDIDYTHKYQ